MLGVYWIKNEAEISRCWKLVEGSSAATKKVLVENVLAICCCLLLRRYPNQSPIEILKKKSLIDSSISAFSLQTRKYCCAHNGLFHWLKLVTL